MSRVGILERKLEMLNYMSQRLPPEELIGQIGLLISGVTTVLEILGLEREKVLWEDITNNQTHFNLDDVTFDLQIDTLRSTLESIIEATKNIDDEFVSLSRIAELKAITSKDYDLSKLISLCNEINICYANDCLFATAMLSRAILDHVPPIFGFTSFDQVANNYSWGKSHKVVVKHLSDSSREISNNLIHTRVSKKIDAPTRTRINCSDGIDIILSEIVKTLT